MLCFNYTVSASARVQLTSQAAPRGFWSERWDMEGEGQWERRKRKEQGVVRTQSAPIYRGDYCNLFLCQPHRQATTPPFHSCVSLAPSSLCTLELGCASSTGCHFYLRPHQPSFHGKSPTFSDPLTQPTLAFNPH